MLKRITNEQKIVVVCLMGFIFFFIPIFRVVPKVFNIVVIQNYFGLEQVVIVDIIITFLVTASLIWIIFTIAFMFVYYSYYGKN